MKYLLWLAIGYIVVWWLFNDRKTSNSVPRQNQAKTEKSGKTERMLQCAQCDIYIPASEAILDIAGTPYCSEKHQRQHTSHSW